LDGPTYPTWYSGIGWTVGLGLHFATGQSHLFYVVQWDRMASGSIGSTLVMGGIPSDSPIYPTWYSAWDRMDSEIRTHTWVCVTAWSAIKVSHEASTQHDICAVPWKAS